MFYFVKNIQKNIFEKVFITKNLLKINEVSILLVKEEWHAKQNMQLYSVAFCIEQLHNFSIFDWNIENLARK